MWRGVRRTVSAARKGVGLRTSANAAATAARSDDNRVAVVTAFDLAPMRRFRVVAIQLDFFGPNA